MTVTKGGTFFVHKNEISIINLAVCVVVDISEMSRYIHALRTYVAECVDFELLNLNVCLFRVTAGRVQQRRWHPVL